VSVRRDALEAIFDIIEHGAYANLRLRSLDSQNAAWVSAAVYTCLDHLYYIDHLLSHFVKGNIKPIIRCVLRLGFSQVLYMDVPTAAACDESVKLCREIGKAPLSGFVNGVMRNFCRNLDALPPLPQEDRRRLSVQYSYPPYLVDMYVDKYGVDFTEAMFACRLEGIGIRAQWPYSTKDLCARLEERGITYYKGKLSPDAVRVIGFGDPAADPLFLEGLITVQSESAMRVCEVMEPKAGDYLLDACAAPGGKSAYLSALLQGSGHIDAWEIHPHRAKLTENTLKRLGVKNVSVSVRDAAAFDPDYKEKYDGVLLDVPCSGLGVSSKPDVRYAKSKEMIEALAQTQRDILNACCNYVRVGGRLIYATCTISEKENEEQIRKFLKRHPGFCLEEEQQLFPHIHQSEGFYYAKLRRCK